MPPAPPRRGPGRPPKTYIVADVLEALAKHVTLTAAAKALGMDRSTLLRLMRADPALAQGFAIHRARQALSRAPDPQKARETIGRSG